MVPEWSWSLSNVRSFSCVFVDKRRIYVMNSTRRSLDLRKKVPRWRSRTRYWDEITLILHPVFISLSLSTVSQFLVVWKNTFTSVLLCYTVSYHNDQQSLVFRFETLVPIGSKVCSCSPLSISKALMVKLETAENKASNLDIEVSKKYTQSVSKHFICC